MLIMGNDSDSQVILTFEGFAAELTGEASLVAMRQLVLGQGRRTREDFGTHLLTQRNSLSTPPSSID